ncbi:methylhydantoinase [Sulfitobacter sp. JL08]|uniref:hydantoinase/oxoprolinase family protein n=1 Tax=Sulfitobacter sp. JL08 TaxID=2070369 RepID=UPI000E0A2BB2|nr:hydantoinase/oxoprolinase family protein [Sulfitobacter sp. JL08]AXI56420.1 methylhydantoinase [Sulfitobacter sp. JL08]
MTSQSSLRLAVDIGGTFTDTVLMNGKLEVLATAKTPTTPENPTIGALDGAHIALDLAGHQMADVTGFIHGTTLATNALIERRGAQVATITTAGFRDILEIAYERRYSQYDINLTKPDLLVTRDRSLTIGGRMNAKGQELTPLDTDAVPVLLEQLDACGADAVAICLLHSYANADHEQALARLILHHRPDLVVSVSSDISPEAREFERLCTTVANAYVQPLMSRYLKDFANRFAAHGLTCPILMMTAGGGMTTLETAVQHPIRLVESGPAGGAILAARVAAQSGETEVLSFDMGGTTAKLCLIDRFQPQTARNFEISRAERFIKGSGMPVRIPVLEMIEIGAGGGSIASVDRLGRLKVGPQSAGSEPGPAAFAKGGSEPTVTDSDVVLGLIDPDRFAEGRLKIDAGAAQNALAQYLAAALQTDSIGAAIGISEIVDESMASAGRMHAIESGKDLATRTMIAFGGNGPLHATRVARRAGVSRILIPHDPGVGSAVGFLFAPVSFEIVRSRYATLDDLDTEALNRFFEEMAQQASAVVRAGAPDQPLHQKRSAFMRYHGQGHEIEIALPERKLAASDIAGLKASFEREYSQQFSRIVPGMKIEIMNWALTVSTHAQEPSPETRDIAQNDAQPDSTRTIICDITGQPAKAGVYLRKTLRPGDTLNGPALILEPQTTTFVSRDFRARVDANGTLVLTQEERV